MSKTMSKFYDVTDLTDAGFETFMKVGAGQDVVLPPGLSDADLGVLKDLMVAKGNDPARVTWWLSDYHQHEDDQREACEYLAAQEE